MKITEKYHIVLFEIRNFFHKKKVLIWNKNILLFWYRLWIRKNEFHSSLRLDEEAISEMNNEEKEKYFKELMHRRWIPHHRK